MNGPARPKIFTELSYIKQRRLRKFAAMVTAFPYTPPRTLFHASPDRAERTHIEPRPSHTCVYHEFDTWPEMQAEHTGDLVFATSELDTAYAYAFKLRDPVRTENGVPYSYLIGGINPLYLRNGGHVPVAMISDRKEYLELLKTVKPLIYKIPQSQRFKQVYSREGVPMGEYISREQVPVDASNTIAPQSINEAMMLGVQFFFLKDGLTKEEFRTELTRMYEHIGTYQPGPEFAQHANACFANFLKEMLDRGLLEHYNRECGLAPVNVKTLDFPAHRLPLRFAADIAMRRSVLRSQPER